MASAEQLKMTHDVDGKVMGVDNRVIGVDNRVKGVEGKVQDVLSDVHDIGNRVQGVEGRVQGVDDKIDQVNSSLSLQPLFVPNTHTSPQGTNLEIVFHDGFRPQIHPLIIISHAKLITRVQLNGFFKGVYSMNGNPTAPSCGYTENVRYSGSSPSVKS